ncbi:MAG: hypothetical protein WAX44_02170 [Minisyncoccia bacterium]
MKKILKRNKGQVMLTAVMFFMFISITIVFGIVTPILKQVRISQENYKSKQSFYLSMAGMEDVLYRIKNGENYSTTEVLSLNGEYATTTTTDVTGGKKVTSIAKVNNNSRSTQANLVLGVGVAFYYGVQAGQGGFDLQNSSSIIGNVYSAGPITGSGNYIYGNVVSSGSSGLIDDIHATGTAYAHTIQDSTIDKDAYYTTKTNTTVGGISYPGSPDMPDAVMPISDAQIAIWESDAEAGGSVTCSGSSYTVNTTITIGPKKIPCNLVLSNNAVVNLTGPVWVEGNITAQNSTIIKVDTTLGNKSVAMIADKISDRLNYGRIILRNSSSFQNSGTTGSFVFMISMNNSIENGGGVKAIENSNSAGGTVVLYAPHGLIELQNSINVKEVTAYRITLQNSAQVRYDTGLPSTLFDSGPGGGFDITTWLEVP